MSIPNLLSESLLGAAAVDPSAVLLHIDEDVPILYTRRDPFRNSNGFLIHSSQYFTQQTRCLVFCFHGLGSYSNAPGQLALRDKLARSGCAVFTMDFQGHGASEGERCLIEHTDTYIDDMQMFVTNVLAEFPDRPFFLNSISMSGGMNILLSLDWQNGVRKLPQRDLWLGNMLLCPAIRNTLAPSPLVLFLLRCLCVPCCPSASPSFLPSTHKYRDAAVAASMLSDENRWHGPVRFITGDRLLHMMDDIYERLSNVAFPFLVVHGTADSVISPAGSEELFNLAKTRDDLKQHVLVQDSFHDLLSDPNFPITHRAVLAFMEMRLSQHSCAKCK